MTCSAPLGRGSAVMLRYENPQGARQRNLPAFGLANHVDEFFKRKLALVGYFTHEVPELCL
jgi:hypothetical protein